MEGESKREKHYEAVENCLKKLNFISSLCHAVSCGGVAPNLDEFATEGLGLICNEMREQLNPVASYLQGGRA
jgi:hypothetical protein